MMEAKFESSKDVDSNADNSHRQSKAGKVQKNEYAAEAHENIHASGKKMRHEKELKNSKHHDDKNREQDNNRWEKDNKRKVLDAKPLKDKLGDDFYQDSDSSEDEGLPDYKIGGYHPVHVGEVFKDRYVIIQKLGWGHFSTVWLAKDKLHGTYVALKVQKSAQHYIEAAYDEVEILDQVSSFWRKKEWQDSLKHYYKDNPKVLKNINKSSKYCHTVQLLNSFMHHGPNGKHYVMVFEILGVNLLEIIKRYDYRGIPLHLVRELTKQCLIGLDYMNRICKLIHTDLKPENVVITLTKNELKQIRDNGVLKTTKMYHQDDELIARAVAGAHDNIVLSHREVFDDEPKNNNCDQTASEMGMSKDVSEMNAKEKKKLRKRKRKQVKKYIASGRLPQNYDDLPKQEQERLYNELRQKINHDNLQKEGIAHGKQHTQEEEKTEIPKDIEISNNDIGLEADSTTVTNKNTEARQTDTENNEEVTDSAPKESPKKSGKKKPKAVRHYSVPKKGGMLDENDIEEDIKEVEKLKQLMLDGMETLPNIPKLNTNLIKEQEKYNERVTKRGPKINEDVNLAIVDMGNGCWTHHHFTSQIQTRQYRSPETIIGVPYGPSADIWSLACMTFELLTGDFLFEPRKGYYYDKDDDHLAQMIELLGQMPKNFALSGKNSKRFFDSTGHLRRIRGLNYWPLHRVLTEKYRFREEESKGLADFLLAMLTWYPEKRATAQEMLEHPWLKMPRNDDYKMGDDEYEKMMTKIKIREGIEKEKIRSMSELDESNYEKNGGDIEDFEFTDIESEIPVNENEDSISLGFDDPDNEYDFHVLNEHLNKSLDHDPNARTYIKEKEEEYELFTPGGFGRGKTLNNSYTGAYNA